MSILAGLTTVLFAHAHPDDESLSTGALIAHLHRSGVRVALLTATRGELGGVVDGEWKALEGTDALTNRREQELACAIGVLGIDDSAFLGTPPARRAGESPRIYRDSGMRWIAPGQAGPADDHDERSFAAASLDAVPDMCAYIAHVRPDLVITYDANGGYGHPDHVTMHRVAREAARRMDVRFAEILFPQHVALASTPPDGHVEWFDLPEELPTLMQALRCHTTQMHVLGNEVVHTGGQRMSIETAVGLRLRSADE